MVTQAVENIANPIPVPALLSKRMDRVRVAILVVVNTASQIQTHQLQFIKQEPAQVATRVVVNTVWKVRKNIRLHQNHSYNLRFSTKMELVQVVTQAVENIANPIPVPALLLQRMELVRVVIQAVEIIAWLIPMLDLPYLKVDRVRAATRVVVSTV